MKEYLEYIKVKQEERKELIRRIMAHKPNKITQKVGGHE